MAQFQEVQKKAQSELDGVVGPDRLPEFSDLKSLPYTMAITKELLRWHIVTPIGLPHRTVADDEYDGYLVPGGSIVFVDVWCVTTHYVTNFSKLAYPRTHPVFRGISRDPAVYPDPEDFIPERFLDANGQLDVTGKDPSDYAFGFGRRWVLRFAPAQALFDHILLEFALVGTLPKQLLLSQLPRDRKSVV